MSLAPLVITAVIVEGRSKTSVARDYGITRFWVQTLVKRFQVEGEAALQPYSRRPHGLAPRSVRKYHVMLHSIFQRAVRDQLILTTPCEHTELPKVVLRRSSPLIPSPPFSWRSPSCSPSNVERPAGKEFCRNRGCTGGVGQRQRQHRVT